MTRSPVIAVLRHLVHDATLFVANRLVANRLVANRLVANRLVAYVPWFALRRLFYRRVRRFHLNPKCSLSMGVWFDAKGGPTVGANCTVNQGCRLDTRGGITLEDHVALSAEVCILTADHDMETAGLGSRVRPVHIRRHVFVGTRAMILPGVTTGEGAGVGVGSVVTRDVPAFTVVAGNPARPINTRSVQETAGGAYRRWFH